MSKRTISFEHTAASFLRDIRDGIRAGVKLLKLIEERTRPKRATRGVVAITEELLGGFPMADHKFDKVKVHLRIAYDGDIDAPPTFSKDGPGDFAVDEDGLGAVLTSAEPGQVDYKFVATADDPVTEDVTESVITGGSFTWSHSKATAGNVSETEEPLAS